MQVQSLGSQGLPAPAQAPAHARAGDASDADGARRREGAGDEASSGKPATPEPRRSAVAQAYTAAGRAVHELAEERPGISVLA